MARVSEGIFINSSCWKPSNSLIFYRVKLKPSQNVVWLAPSGPNNTSWAPLFLPSPLPRHRATQPSAIPEPPGGQPGPGAPTGASAHATPCRSPATATSRGLHRPPLQSWTARAPVFLRSFSSVKSPFNIPCFTSFRSATFPLESKLHEDRDIFVEFLTTVPPVPRKMTVA